MARKKVPAEARTISLIDGLTDEERLARAEAEEKDKKNTQHPGPVEIAKGRVRSILAMTEAHAAVDGLELVPTGDGRFVIVSMFRRNGTVYGFTVFVATKEQLSCIRDSMNEVLK